MRSKPISFINMLMVSLSGFAIFCAVFTAIYFAYGKYVKSLGIYDSWWIITSALCGTLFPACCVLLKACIVTRLYPTVSVTTLIAVAICTASLWWCNSVMNSHDTVCLWAYTHVCICTLVLSHAASYVSMQQKHWLELKEIKKETTQFEAVGEVPADVYEDVMRTVTIQSEFYEGRDISQQISNAGEVIEHFEDSVNT